MENSKKNIKTIAPFLVNDFIDKEEQFFDTEEYSNFLNQNAVQLGLFKKYLICKLHDSRIIELIHDLDSLKIKLNDFSTHVFADAIIEREKIKIPHNKLVFPLTIELKGKLEFSYNTVDNNGFLNEIATAEVNEYLCEQVTKIENDRIEIVFHFWKDAKKKRQGERIIIIASAKKLIITEKQDSAWSEIFGNKYDGYYEYFKEQFDSERYVSDHNNCLKLIDEYEKKQMNDNSK